MAYKNLVNIVCADKTEFFCRMRDFICKRNGTYDYSTTGIGWTLIDSSYAVDEDNPAIGDWYIIYSPGEDGDQDLFFHVSWTSGYMAIKGWQSWDSTAHAGGQNYNNQNNISMPETAGGYGLWIYGDLSTCVPINKLATSDFRGAYFGMHAPAYDYQDGIVGTCSTTLTAGSDVSIVLDAVPSSWTVGQEIFIRTTHTDAVGTVEIEIITIKTIDGNTITADLVDSYTADSKLSDFVGYCCQSTWQFGSSSQVLIGNDGTKAANPTGLTSVAVPIATMDPDPLNDVYGMVPYMVSHATYGAVGKYRDFVLATPYTSLVSEDVMESLDGLTNRRALKMCSVKWTTFLEV